MRAFLFIFIAIVLHAPVSLAQCSLFPLGGYVGVFADSTAQDPQIVFDAVPSLRPCYIVAILDGATTNGFTGLQFRLEIENPNAWFLNNPSFPGASVVLGNVFDAEPNNPSNAAGVLVAWPTCRVGVPAAAGTPVLIGSFTAVPTPGAESTDLLVKQQWPPTNPGAPCARFALCDPPDFSRAPMPARELDPLGEEIVFRSSLIIDKAVSVTSKTWSGVKRLFD
jgi:hypothetical protein